MCEIFALTSKEKVRMNDIFEIFYSHSLDHRNGWGLALLDQNPPAIEKEAVRAFDSSKLRKRLKSDILTSRCIAHIRLATIGEMSMDNTHPFTGHDDSGRQWVLAHNGTIFESGLLTPYQYIQKGRTDSERILLYIIDKMNRLIRNGVIPDGGLRIGIIEDMIRTITPGNKVNLMIYDGEFFYIHKNEPGSLYIKSRNDSEMFCTRPLTLNGWEEAPQNTLLVYKDGELIWSGKQHNNTYIHDERKMKLLYFAYSGL